jgi:hypothetical protein
VEENLVVILFGCFQEGAVHESASREESKGLAGSHGESHQGKIFPRKGGGRREAKFFALRPNFE